MKQPGSKLRAASDARSAWPETVVALLTGAVLMCRLLTPTEGAVLGETLWIAQLALLGGLSLVFAAYWSSAAPIRWTWFDAAVALVAFGHGLSAAVNWSTLDRRAACNMLCEWSGLLATWLLLRWCLSRAPSRRAMCLLLLSAGTALSGLGLWQHFVSIPATRGLVERFEREWQRLHDEKNPVEILDTPGLDERLRRLQKEQVELGIPADAGARMVWLDRVKNSSEPFGLFALANTFAGLLLTVLLLALWVLVELLQGDGSGVSNFRFRISDGRKLAIGRLLLLSVLVVPIAYCLLLTKSRTAFVGLLAGIALLGLASLGRGLARRTLLVGAAGALLLIVLLGTAAAFTGGLDRLVFSESLKSLRYRAEYWTGAWRMLTDSGLRIFAGVGPGNFRPSYLKYKLPESSEEIADPHNLLFDMWAGGGIPAAIGMLGLLGAGFAPLIRQGAYAAKPNHLDVAPTGDGLVPGRQPERALQNPNAGLALLVGAALAFGLVLVFAGGFEARLVFVAIGWLAAAVCWRAFLPAALPRVAAAIALASLAIHLLGAGGIEMPAIVQTVFVLVILSRQSESNARPATTGGLTPPAPPFKGGERATVDDQSSDRPVGRLTLLCAALLVVGLYVAVWFWGLSPVMQSRALLAIGDDALTSRGRADLAEREYRAAAAADPLGYEAYARLADLAGRRWIEGGRASDSDFEQAVDWSLRAIERFPRNIAARQAIAARYLDRFEHMGRPDDARRAADILLQAVELYPTDASLQALCAEALWKGEEPGPARGFAERALELHEISRQAGHVDKLLSAERLEKLREIVGDDRGAN